MRLPLWGCILTWVITFLIVRDAGLRASSPMILVVVVQATATATVARLLSGCLLLTWSGRRLGGCRVDLVHVTVAIVRHTDLAAIYLGQWRRKIVLHQVLVLQVVVRMVVHVFHLRTATGTPMVVVTMRPSTWVVSTIGSDSNIFVSSTTITTRNNRYIDISHI